MAAKKIKEIVIETPKQFNEHIFNLTSEIADIVIVTDKLVKSLRDKDQNAWKEVERISKSTKPILLAHLTSLKKGDLEYVKGIYGVLQGKDSYQKPNGTVSTEHPGFLMGFALPEALNDLKLNVRR